MAALAGVHGDEPVRAPAVPVGRLLPRGVRRCRARRDAAVRVGFGARRLDASGTVPVSHQNRSRRPESNRASVRPDRELSSGGVHPRDGRGVGDRDDLQRCPLARMTSGARFASRRPFLHPWDVRGKAVRCWYSQGRHRPSLATFWSLLTRQLWSLGGRWDGQCCSWLAPGTSLRSSGVLGVVGVFACASGGVLWTAGDAGRGRRWTGVAGRPDR